MITIFSIIMCRFSGTDARIFTSTKTGFTLPQIGIAMDLLATPAILIIPLFFPHGR